MKTSHALLTLFTIVLCSCGQQQKENNDFTEFDYNSESQFDNNSNNTSDHNNQNNSFEDNRKDIADNNSNGQLKAYKIMNKQFGMVFGIMPIPQSWKESDKNKDNILFEGPNGVKVYGEQFNSFYYSNNQQQNQYAQQGGSNVKAPKSLDRLINEDFKPFLEKKGLRYVGQFPLPQLAQADLNFQQSIFKATPEQRNYQCVVTEWEDTKGVKSIGVIRYFTAQYTSIGGMDWGYTINSMEAPKAIFEQAKKDFINALINFKVNPNWLQANNQYYAQASQQSNAGHQQRMAAIQAQGQASRNISNTYSSISDSNHESWKRRNGMTDAGHAKSVDAVWDRSNMNDQNGNQYKVEGYYDNVWKGGNDQYIGTNNTNWNPNIDNATNGTNYEQLEYTDDNY
jgi:hypothetical protein